MLSLVCNKIQSIKAELLIPLFIGVLGSLFLCTMIGTAYGYFQKPAIPESVVEAENDDVFVFSAFDKTPDPVLEYYRNPDFQEWVIDFFTWVCSSREIAQAILVNADRYNVPPALAFALSWEESRFNPRAINRSNRNGSVDRGLFQLNNLSFPHLEIPAFYEIELNSRYGVSYLRNCLDLGGTVVSALAMYNAGSGRVRSTGAPHVTLNYVSRIMENRQKIETNFHSKLIKEEEARLVAEDTLAQIVMNKSQRIARINANNI